MRIAWPARSSRSVATGVLFGLLVTFAAASAPSPIAQAVVQLRQDIELLSTELADERAATRSHLTSLRQERDDLARQVRLEKIKKETYALAAQKRQAEAQGLSQSRRAWVDAGLSTVAVAHTMVLSTCPLHKEARLAQLARIEAELKRPTADVATAFERLWRFFEEEEALSRQVGMDEQVFVEGGKKRIWDVVHIGLSALYAHDGAGTYAIVECPSGTLTPVADAQLVTALEALFAHVGHGDREIELVLPKAALDALGDNHAGEQP